MGKAVIPRKTYCVKGHLLSKTRVKSGKKWRCSVCLDTTERENGRSGHLRRKYNMTVDDYEAILAAQKYECAICGTKEWKGRRGLPNIDHDHTTGRVRGILCWPCNNGIGHLKDSPTILRKAAQYLEKYTV